MKEKKKKKKEDTPHYSFHSKPLLSLLNSESNGQTFSGKFVGKIKVWFFNRKNFFKDKKGTMWTSILVTVLFLVNVSGTGIFSCPFMRQSVQLHHEIKCHAKRMDLEGFYRLQLNVVTKNADRNITISLLKFDQEQQLQKRVDAQLDQNWNHFMTFKIDTEIEIAKGEYIKLIYKYGSSEKITVMAGLVLAFPEKKILIPVTTNKEEMADITKIPITEDSGNMETVTAI